MSQDNFVVLAKEWLEKGAHDIDEAYLSFGSGGWTDIICFHYLTKLWNECQKSDQSFSIVEEDCIILNPYYIEPRYPLGAPKVYTRKEAEEALASAEKITDFVQSKIEKE